MLTEKISRRDFLWGAGVSLAAVSPPVAFLRRYFLDIPQRSEKFISDFKDLMLATARSCVREGNWIVPSTLYQEYFFSRDSFWVLAALKERKLSEMAVRRFAKDQQLNSDGHIATALYKDGSRPEYRDRDEESTLMFVLHNYLLQKLGGSPNKEALKNANEFITKHVKNGRYVTIGETRTGPLFGGRNQVGTYHYWLDTFRPAGRAVTIPTVFSYNQGLLCVATRCLEEMGVTEEKNIRKEAESVYSRTVNPKDRVSLPQAEGSTNVDVSSLVGEALSLYLWNESILGKKRVQATVNRLRKVRYPDGKFLGFKVVSQYDGSFLPGRYFSGGPVVEPGNYQNGGSWLLYDGLALYAAARHNIAGASELFLQRLESEVRFSWRSNEYLSTNQRTLGQSEEARAGYGWNSFVANLLSV